MKFLVDYQVHTGHILFLYSCFDIPRHSKSVCLTFFHLFTCGLSLPDTYFWKLWLWLLEILVLRRSEIDFNTHLVSSLLSCVRLREKMDMHAESIVNHKVLSVIYEVGIVYYMSLTKINFFKIITIQKKNRLMQDFRFQEKWNFTHNELYGINY